MSQYLQVKVADVHVLLAALNVHEVMRVDDLVTQADAHVDWRDRIIAFRDLGHVLGRNSSPQRRHYGVVYSCTDDGAEPVMLQVDEVLGLREPKADEWRPLPGIQTRAQVLLDGVWTETATQRNSYRLRHPTVLDDPALLA